MTWSLDPELWNDDRARLKKAAASVAENGDMGGIECSGRGNLSDDCIVISRVFFSVGFAPCEHAGIGSGMERKRGRGKYLGR